MFTLVRSKQALGAVAVLVAALAAQGQNAFSPGGVEYPIAGVLPGDQTAPHAAIGGSGGYLVWQDNATDGDGLGIRAERLDRFLNKVGPVFRVNAIGAGDQEKPQVAMLSNGGAVFVWQGGKYGFQNIFARLLPASGTNFSTTDIQVNTYTNEFQIDPAVAVLANGDVVVVWSSYGQDGYYQGIYGQRLSSTGTKLGGEFQINQYPFNNQRTPAVAALSGGGFVVAWVSENGVQPVNVHTYARLYNNTATALGSEFRVNSSTANICANPSVAGSADGGFAVAWSQRDVTSTNSTSETFTVSGTTGFSPNSWDVYTRIFRIDGVAFGTPFRLNTMLYGDQYAPRIAAFGSSFLATWLGLGQDGSWEGIYGQFFTGSAELAGVEFQVNTANATRQINPVIASDGANRFLVVWASYANSSNYDLFAREYELIQLKITPLASGARLSWNTKAGLVYQVQSSTNYSIWNNHGPARTATGLSDSIDVTSGPGAVVYRVVRIQ